MMQRTPSAGLFFEKRASPEDARFFRDLEGRDAGNFFKLATPDPTFLWDEPVADGFHRPTNEQPEAVEYGGERFHSTDAEPGPGSSAMRTVVDRGAAAGKGRMRKHAAPLFGGTSFEKAALGLGDLREAGGRALETGKEVGGKVLDHAGRLGGQAIDTLKGSGRTMGESLDEASRSPLGAAAILGGAGLVGAKAVGGAARGAGRGARGIARGVKRLVRGRPPPPKGLLARGLAGLQHLVRK